MICIEEAHLATTWRSHRGAVLTPRVCSWEQCCSLLPQVNPSPLPDPHLAEREGKEKKWEAETLGVAAWRISSGGKAGVSRSCSLPDAHPTQTRMISEGAPFGLNAPWNGVGTKGREQQDRVETPGSSFSAQERVMLLHPQDSSKPECRLCPFSVLALRSRFGVLNNSISVLPHTSPAWHADSWLIWARTQPSGHYHCCSSLLVRRVNERQTLRLRKIRIMIIMG